MSPRAPPRIVLFAAFSASVHAAAFAFVGRSRPSLEARPPEPAPQPVDWTLAGDTLDVDPEPIAHADPSALESPGGAEVAKVPARTTRIPSRESGGEAHDRPRGEAGDGLAPPLFGAVGVRYAADLASAFAHAFPQAASADSVWMEAPFGSAGSIEMDLTLDEAGRIANTAIGGAPSLALRRGVDRTLALLAPRAFTSGGAHTRLRVTARVTRDDVHDGLHGDVFALSGGSFAGRTGTAFFALPGGTGSGRRVDVEIVLAP